MNQAKLILEHLQKHDVWHEEKETITIHIDGVDFQLKLTCDFVFTDGEENEHGIAKQVFSHVINKHIKILEIYGMRTKLEHDLNEGL